mmetsp:Transcript_37161/g.109629  ORF Transcript_37161/g.109629 Transcript_37161/m.109629 type:complete len:207 (-) Transcript_37161:391-1011(-)
MARRLQLGQQRAGVACYTCSPCLLYRALFHSPLWLRDGSAVAGARANLHSYACKGMVVAGHHSRPERSPGFDWPAADEAACSGADGARVSVDRQARAGWNPPTDMHDETALVALVGVRPAGFVAQTSMFIRIHMRNAAHGFKLVCLISNVSFLCCPLWFFCNSRVNSCPACPPAATNCGCMQQGLISSALALQHKYQMLTTMQHIY